MEHLMSIPLRQIDGDPRFQIRLQWDPATDDRLAGLAASLAGPEGLIHPIVVVRLTEPTTFGRLYALIAGHRRLAAVRQLGWENILARVLPACDLALPQHQLHLLAIAVRENTEREDLPPADRRAALQRLEALYVSVHPETATLRRPGRTVAEPPPPEPFPRWAARITRIPAHTIRRDLRCRLFTGGLALGPPSAPTTAPTDAAPATLPTPGLPDPVQETLRTAQHVTSTLQTLATAWTLATRSTLPETQFAALHQQLETLQTALTSIWPLVRMPTEHPLVPFVLVAREQLAALRGTLWGLRTGAPDAWETVPLPVVRALHAAMAAVLADWQVVATAMPARRPSPPVETPPPRASPPPWGHAVAQA
jgi:hypothetical protein